MASPGLTAHELAVLCVGSTLIAVQVVAISVRIVRGWPHQAHPWSCLRYLWGLLGRWLWPTSQPASEEIDKEIEEYVASEMHRRLTVNMRHAIGVACLSGSALILWRLANLSQPRERSEVQDWVLVVGTCACTTGHLHPARFVDGFSGVWHAVLMLFMMGMVGAANFRIPSCVVLWCTVFLPMRLALSLAYLRMPATIFWNAVFTSVSIFAYARIPGAAATENRENLLNYCAINIVALAGIVAMAARYGSMIHSEFRLVATTCVLHGERTAMRRLLDLLCDVVVALDSELTVMRHAPRLRALVGLNPNTNLQGARLQDFMATDDDKRRFEQLLGASQHDTEGSIPGVVHATIRDNIGVEIKTQIFYVKFQGVGGSCHYLAGIQEIERNTRRKSSQCKTSASLIPAAQEWEESEGESDDDESDEVSAPDDYELALSGTSVTADVKRLMVPRFIRTSKWAEDVSLLGAIMTWNVSMRASACCPYHVYLGEAIKACNRLMQLKCKPEFRVEWSAQCEECGLLSPWSPTAEGEGDQGQMCNVCCQWSVRCRRETIVL